MAKQPSKKLVAYDNFQNELTKRADEIASQLPGNIRRDRFLNAAIAAVKQTPEILKATPRSIFTAITKAAQDGLMPDGREGVITVYRTQNKDGSWSDLAQWNPMIYGLRKRAREIDDVIVNAQVVHAGDEFVWEEGDEPRIVHKPAKLGTPRGEMVGAYAIIKKDDHILHREVMDAGQINSVREQSKAKNGMMWTKFADQAWRKTVARRAFKSVPCSERLSEVIQRDDDMFDFTPVAQGTTLQVEADQQPETQQRKSTTTVVENHQGDGRKPLPPVVGQQNKSDDENVIDEAEVIEDESSDSDDAVQEESEFRLPDDLNKWADDYEFQLRAAESLDQLNEVRQSTLHERLYNALPEEFFKRVESVYQELAADLANEGDSDDGAKNEDRSPATKDVEDKPDRDEKASIGIDSTLYEQVHQADAEMAKKKTVADIKKIADDLMGVKLSNAPAGLRKIAEGLIKAHYSRIGK